MKPDYYQRNTPGQHIRILYKNPVKGVWRWSVTIGDDSVASGIEKTQAKARAAATAAKKEFLHRISTEGAEGNT